MRLFTKSEIEEVKNVEEQIEKLKKIQSAYKEKILKKMQNNNVRKVELDGVVLTVKESYDRVDLNKKQLEVDFPELVKKYSKTTQVKETLLIKL